MRGAIRLALCLLGLLPARADDGRRSRLLVAYVAGRDAVSEKRIGPVLDIWRGMHHRDDIEMFGYAFPANRTIVPWGEAR